MGIELIKKRGVKKGYHFKPESERHRKQMQISITNAQFETLCKMTSRYDLYFSTAFRACFEYVCSLSEEEQRRILCNAKNL